MVNDKDPSDRPTRKQVQGTRSSYVGLCGLARLLGYHDPHIQQLLNNDGTSASDLIEFFDDNPGAIEAVVDWVLDNHDLSDPDDDDSDEAEDEG